MTVRVVSLLEDIATLARAGVLKPLGPRTTIAVGRQFMRDGIKPHLVHTLHAAQTPNKAATVFEANSKIRITTWAELNDRIKRLANHFLSRGLEPGNGVAIMLVNRPEFIEANAAAIRIGATISFINPRSPVHDAKQLLDRMAAKLLVTHRDDLAGATDAIVLRVGDDYERAIADAPSNDPAVDRDAVGRVVIFTSGTTGRPKGAVRSLNEGASPSALAGFLRTIPFRASDIHMVVCPLYHSSGSGFATIAQVLGNTLVIVERFSPEAFCEHVQRHKVTTTTVVPTMLHQITGWADARSYDLSSLRVVVCTGSPLREEVRDAARELLGDVVFDLYGSTEMGWVSVARPEDQRSRPGTVGKPVPGVDIRITDNDGNMLPRGERGEIWTKSQLGMEGYVDDPELTNTRMQDGYVSVRDIGYLDSDDYLRVVDRADDMIISGGVNVYPAETEVVLSSHPRVREAAVFGVPDPKWGQKIVAAVVGEADVAAGELIEWCKSNASYAAVPKEIRFYESLPRNDIGKTDKRSLVETWE